MEYELNAKNVRAIIYGGAGRYYINNLRGFDLVMPKLLWTL